MSLTLLTEPEPPRGSRHRKLRPAFAGWWPTTRVR